jgi:hypothetical protein
MGAALGLLVPAAAAGDPGRATSAPSLRDTTVGAPRSAPRRPARSPAAHRERRRTGLEAFAEQRRREARAGVRAELRDLDRASTLRALEREGSPEALERFRAAARADDELDALRARGEHERPAPGRRDWRALEAWSGRPLGPVTRRLLDESRVRLRTTERQLDLDARLRPLERRLAPQRPSLPERVPPPPDRLPTR